MTMIHHILLTLQHPLPSFHKWCHIHSCDLQIKAPCFDFWWKSHEEAPMVGKPHMFTNDRGGHPFKYVYKQASFSLVTTETGVAFVSLISLACLSLQVWWKMVSDWNQLTSSTSNHIPGAYGFTNYLCQPFSIIATTLICNSVISF